MDYIRLAGLRGPFAPGGTLEDAATPAAVWTVDAESGAVQAPGGPRGGPSAGLVRRAARHLAGGGPATPLGALDLAERGVMQVRRGYAGGGVPSVVGLLLALLALRLALGVYGDIAGRHWLA